MWYAVISWTLFIGWSVVFYCLWQSNVAVPHYSLALVSLASQIGVTVGVIGLFFIRSEKHRKHPQSAGRFLHAAGWFLIGTFPLASFGAHFLDAALAFGHRLSRPVTPVRHVAHEWLSSYFDMCSRFGNRRTSGEHVLLVDSGDVRQPETMVRSMDEHVQSMCELLEQSPPSNVVWVRGSISGQTGLSVLGWAITAPNEDPNALTTLDRHEVAHAVISGLCDPDKEPPHLLVEGWAQMQSEDRSQMIEGLVNAYRNGDYFQIDELIREPWYSSSRWPVYQYGGPFVTYLVERHGGPKFFELYRSAKRMTFRDDAARILGAPWREVESDFWRWLVDESQRIVDAAGEQGSLETQVRFSDESTRELWDKLTSRYRPSDWSHEKTPSSLAVVLTTHSIEPNQPPEMVRQLHAVFQGSDCWIRYLDPNGNRNYVEMSDARWAQLSLDKEGVLSGSSDVYESRNFVRSQMLYYLNMIRNRNDADPATRIPLGPDPSHRKSQFDIVSLEAPNEESQRWRIKYTSTTASQSEDEPDEEQSAEIELDDSDRLAIVRWLLERRSGKEVYSWEIRHGTIGDLRLPVFVRHTMRDLDQGSSDDIEVDVRELRQVEVDSFISEVRGITRTIDTRRARFWFEYVPTVAATMPLAGALLIWAGRRKTRRTRHWNRA